jgi:hypothetical protein
MKPEQIAKAGTEHAHQAALFCWAAQNREQYPQLEWMFAVPNGGERQVAVAARLKAEGVRAGVADIFLPTARHGHHGLFIEMKKPADKDKKVAAGRQSDKQVEFENHVTAQGFLYTVCFTWEEARDVIMEYLG